MLILNHFLSAPQKCISSCSPLISYFLQYLSRCQQPTSSPEMKIPATWKTDVFSTWLGFTSLEMTPAFVKWTKILQKYGSNVFSHSPAICFSPLFWMYRLSRFQKGRKFNQSILVACKEFCPTFFL